MEHWIPQDVYSVNIAVNHNSDCTAVQIVSAPSIVTKPDCPSPDKKKNALALRKP